jgi:hypothetical protein
MDAMTYTTARVNLASTKKKTGKPWPPVFCCFLFFPLDKALGCELRKYHLECVFVL